jgi:hypothetical protein
MNSGTQTYPTNSGGWVRATYIDQLVDDYRGNPYLEALPPIYASEQLAQGMMFFPSYDEADRQLPSEVRQHYLSKVLSFVQPLSIHIDLAHRMSRLLRGGYVGRNPAQPSFRMEMENSLGALSTGAKRRGPAATGMTIAGISGIGKSTAVDAILSMYPQVIEHAKYAGKPFTVTQVVYLKLNCPFNSSVKALCLQFLEELDRLLGTRYIQRYMSQGTTTDALLSIMARVAAVHGLGALVVDEIQHLARAKSGGERVMLNFFVQLVNTIGVPVVLVGTYRALELLGREFRYARRGTGQGDVIWHRMEQNAEWRFFCESLWRFQYLRAHTPLTPQIYGALYSESQGITDVLVKLYMLAQIRAIQTNTEKVTPGIIRSVAKDCMQSLQPVLRALRQGDFDLLRRLDDVLAPGLEEIGRQVRRAEITEGLVLRISADTTPAESAPIVASDASSEGTPPTEPQPIAKRPRSPKSRNRGGSLMDIVARGTKKKVSAYDSLRAAGIIAHDGSRVHPDEDPSLPNAPA